MPTHDAQLFLAGSYVDGETDETVTLHSPVTGEHLADLPVPSSDQLDRAVVSDQQLLRKVVDRDPPVLGAAAYHQHCLVTLGGEAAPLRRRFAEMQEAAQRVAERSEQRVLARVELASSSISVLRHSPHLFDLFIPQHRESTRATPELDDVS